MPRTKPISGTPIDWTHPLSRALLAWFPFGDGGGRFANNRGAQAGGLTFTAPAWGAGPFGTAPKWDGATNAAWGTFPTVSLPGPFTVSIWAQIASMSGAHIWLGDPAGAGTVGPKMGLNGVAYFCRPVNTLSSLTFTGSAPVNDGLWHNYVFIRNSTNFVLVYRDGALAATSTAAESGTSTWGGFGCGPDTAQQWTGSLDDLKIYARDLSAAEVARLYAEPFSMYARPSAARFLSASPPSYPGAAAPALGNLSASASGSVAAPTYSGSGSPALGGVSVAAAGSVAGPTYAGSGSPALGPLIVSATGSGPAAPADFPTSMISTILADPADPFGIDPRRTLVELI